MRKFLVFLGLSFMATAGLEAGIVLAPLAHANGTESSLESAVRQVYTQVQTKCTPNMPPNFQGITFDKGYFPGGVGSGKIVDANPSLGGPFDYMWGPPGSPGTPGYLYHRVPAQPDGDWFIELNFC
jgi:hypothetical protein